MDPVFANNGKLKPLYAVVGGQPEHHPEGAYYIRHSRNNWESVGSDPQLALLAQLKRQRTFDAKAAGIEVVEDSPSQTGKRSLLHEASGVPPDKCMACFNIPT